MSDFGYEIRDISGVSENIFYKFIGYSDTLTTSEVESIIEGTHPGLSSNETISLLMWYGFLGIPSKSKSIYYIYNLDYDMRRLEAERDRLGDDLLYIVNPAFLRGLRK